MRGYNVDSAICNHMIRLQSKSVQLAPELCLRCKTLKMTPFKTASLVSTLVVLSALHLYTAQGKFSGDVPPRIADRITPGFRPPAVPLTVVDPYFRFTLFILFRVHALSALFPVEPCSRPGIQVSLAYTFVCLGYGWVTLYLSTNLVCYIYAYVFLCIKPHSSQRMHYGDEYVK